MKYRSFKELRADKNITPEDVAQFALYEREMNDSDKFKAISDLIVCCEKVVKEKSEAENKKLREALVEIKQEALYPTDFSGSCFKMIVIAEQALKPKEE